MTKQNRLPETISIFAVGLAVGAALGVLFAPKSGDDTREIFADTARDPSLRLQTQTQKVGAHSSGHCRHR